MKTELKKIQTDLSPDDLQCFKSHCEDDNVLQSVDEEPSKSSREAFVTITVDFLKRMKQNKFTECLLRSENYSLNFYGDKTFNNVSRNGQEYMQNMCT